VRNPSDTRELLVTLPSTAHEDLSLSYAVKRTTNGAETHSVHVQTAPGAPWQLLAADLEVGEDYQLLTHDLSARRAAPTTTRTSPSSSPSAAPALRARAATSASTTWSSPAS
jgi:hypothetical protein